MYLLNVEAYQESERNFVHISSKVDTNELKKFSLVGILEKDVAVE